MKAPEILFQPDLVGLEYPGVHQCVYRAIARADLDLRKTLYSHIVLAGGSTMFRGAARRRCWPLRATSRMSPRRPCAQTKCIREC